MKKKTNKVKVVKPKVEDIPQYLMIPSEVDIFGRRILTVDDIDKLNLLNRAGEARYGVNEIAINPLIAGKVVTEDEIKLTYLHEIMHFILNFTGYDTILRDGGRVDIEQFVELLAAGIYQYEKSAKY